MNNTAQEDFQKFQEYSSLLIKKDDNSTRNRLTEMQV